MEKTVIGNYASRESRHVSSHWAQICADHEEEFPTIRECFPGTFNVLLAGHYLPPNEAALRHEAKARGRAVGRYEDGNHVSPYAKVVEISGIPVEAWIYRGGHGGRNVLELLSRTPLARDLHLENGGLLFVKIIEDVDIREGMPERPPHDPGRSV